MNVLSNGNTGLGSFCRCESDKPLNVSKTWDISSAMIKYIRTFGNYNVLLWIIYNTFSDIGNRLVRTLLSARSLHTCPQNKIQTQHI